MVRIITDSAADFTPEELARLGIDCIPLTVLFGENEYQENISLTKDGFYDLLLNSGHLPKTAQASPQILLDLWEDAHTQGQEAVYITLSSALSGTFQNAVMSCRLTGYPECYCVDSRNATGGQRMLVEEAVRLRDQGKSASEIAAALEDLRNRIVLFACIDTLEYLYKGGRISHTTYKLGTIANIKPIISIDKEGRVQIPAKAMGMRKGMDILCRNLASNPPDNRYPLYVMYTNQIGVARDLAGKLTAAGLTVSGFAQVGAAIGAHIGPDACGLVYVAQK